MRKLIKFILALILSILLSLFLFYQITTDGLMTKIGGVGILKVESGSMEPVLSVRRYYNC